MTNQQQLEELRAIVTGVVERWGVDNNHGENFQQKTMRALLNLNAFEMDYRNVLEGRRPIRTDYPLPLPAPKPSQP